MFWKDFKSLGLLSVTLACLSGVSAEALAAPVAKEDSFLNDSKQVYFVSLSESISSTPAQAEQTSDFALTSELEFAETKISDAKIAETKTPVVLEQEQSVVEVTTPVTATPAEQRVDDVTPVSRRASDLDLAESTTLKLNEENSSLLAQVETTAPADAPTFVRKDGFYVMLYGVPLQGRDSAQDFIGRANFDVGYGFGGGIGYRWKDFRFDAEAHYFRNEFNDLFFFIPGTTTVAPGQPEQSPNAFVNGRAIMFNAYYDIPIGNLPRFRPYVGAGIGFYNASINDLSPPGFGGFIANGDSPARFAYQLRVGFSYAITNQLDFFTGYRYFKGETFKYTIENSGTPPLVLQPNGLKSNSWEIGLRYVF